VARTFEADPEGGCDIDVPFLLNSVSVYEFVASLPLTPNLRRT
jgi:hypothetical protein